MPSDLSLLPGQTLPQTNTGGVMEAAGGAVGMPDPQKDGWHLVRFKDGSVGVAQWLNGAWNWGDLKPPASPIRSYSYLGTDITHQDSVRWTTALLGLPRKLQATLISVLDHGRLGLSGQPVLFDPKGRPVGGSGVTGSEAVPTNLIPSPIDPNVGNSHLSLPSLSSMFGSLSLWKGVGLVLAGAGLLIFAALEFRRIGG